MRSEPPRCRPRDHLVAAARLYPDAWRLVDVFRAGRGATFPTWPDWCFLPITATATIVAEDAGIDVRELPVRYPERLADAARLAAMAAWRVTQGIYRFDPAVYDAVRATPVAGDVPHEILFRLPEWCVYVETAGLRLGDGVLHGAFAHLEFDLGGRVELRLVLDADEGLMPLPLHLGPWPLAESIARAVDLAGVHALASGVGPLPGGLTAQLRPVVEPLVSLLLYLCSQAAEVGDGSRQPANPSPKRVKGAWRLFAADRATTWDVGVRLGAALHSAVQRETMGEGVGHAGARPHIRRAHWHGYWTGPRDEPTTRRFDLRWMPPIAVNVDDVDGLPATIRPVS